jgi:hypothetical protein
MRFVLHLALVLAAVAAEPRALFNGKDLSGWVQEGPRATLPSTKASFERAGLQISRCGFIRPRSTRTSG